MADTDTPTPAPKVRTPRKRAAAGKTATDSKAASTTAAPTKARRVSPKAKADATAKPATASATRSRAKSATVTPKTKVATATKRAEAGKTPVKPASTRERAFGRETNCLGFVTGTDSDLIARAMIEGGKDRAEINDNAQAAIKRANGLETRGGQTKNVPSLASAILTRMLAAGFTIESNWRLVPPDDVKKQLTAEKAKAARAVKRSTSK